MEIVLLNHGPNTDHEMDLPSTCEVCTTILSHFAPSPPGGYTGLGKFDDVVAQDCPHAVLFRNMKWNFVNELENPVEKILELRCLTIPRAIDFLIRDRIARGSMSTFPDKYALVRREDVADHPGEGLIVDTHWIKGGVVQDWIAACDAAHGSGCGQIPLFTESDLIRPKYLVDTVRSCLVLGSTVETPYVALSYQWGQVPTLRNTSKICHQLLSPGALVDGALASHIPLTIRDAFAVVKHLGYTYLWVDSLCIVQDDNEQLTTELGQMHRIYACATFTIIAADGIDANHGLRGLKNVTASRNFNQKSFELANSEQLVIAHPSNEVELGGKSSRYSSRAWTFQEYLLSRRKLLFVNDGIEWQCGHGLRREDTTRMIQPYEVYGIYGQPSWLHKPIPTLQSYGAMVQYYNRKDLTFPEDAFNAFAGTQNLLHRVHQEGFLYGLSEFWFDMALNWKPASFEGMRRRVASTSSRLDATAYQLPSWSWIGWEGFVEYLVDHELCIFDYKLEQSSGFTEPVAQWYTMGTRNSTQRRPIKSKWYHYKTRDPSLPLPSGWRCSEISSFLESYNKLLNTTHPENHQKRTQCFLHSRNEYPGYWYPFPVPEYIDSSRAAPLPQTAFLFAQTTRAYLFGGNAFSWPGTLLENVIWLTRANGDHVGYLLLLSASDMESFAIGIDTQAPKRVELVATCKGYHQHIFELGKDWNEEFAKMKTVSENVPSGGLGYAPRECVFMLWVEWVDGVAYRRGSGAVAVEAWEMEREGDKVDLVLG